MTKKIITKKTARFLAAVIDRDAWLMAARVAGEEKDEALQFAIDYTCPDFPAEQRALIYTHVVDSRAEYQTHWTAESIYAALKVHAVREA